MQFDCETFMRLDGLLWSAETPRQPVSPVRTGTQCVLSADIR
jgi:hypothetical protein